MQRCKVCGIPVVPAYMWTRPLKRGEEPRLQRNGMAHDVTLGTLLAVNQLQGIDPLHKIGDMR